MKKLAAVLLAAVLFCLATGSAFAEDEEDFPDSGAMLALTWNPWQYFVSPFANSETGEIGPVNVLEKNGQLSGYVSKMLDAGLDNVVWGVGGSPWYLVAHFPVGNYSWEVVAKSCFFDSDGALKVSKTFNLAYVCFDLRDGSVSGNLNRNYSVNSHPFYGLIKYKPLVDAGLSIPANASVWEPAKNDPDFAKIIFNTDLISPPTPSHNLTINYIHTDGQEAAPAYSAELEEGESYSVPSPTVAGYAPDRPTVAGTMGTADVLETVIYNPDAKPPEEIDPPDPGTAGTVTVLYRYEDGSTAAPTKTQTLGPGQMFQIPSPDVPGYTPSRKIIFGYTGSTELVFDVTYTQQAAASVGGIFFAPPDKQDGVTWNPGGNSGITWNPNSGGGITFQLQQSGGIFFSVPKSIGAYPFDIPRRWSLWP